MKRSPALALLIERLNWPLPRVRWEAARQVAALIKAGDQSAKRALLDWSRRQYLEADALTIVSLVHSFGLQFAFSFDELKDAMRAPSILSDALLSDLYRGNSGQLGSERYGFAAGWPLGSSRSHGFEDGQGTIVPLIFKSAFETEQKRSGLPFMDRWEAEWNHLQDAYKESYTQPHFFVAGDRGSTVTADVRQRSVFLSAFLRTLSFAHVEWEMPWSEAMLSAELALPFNDGLSGFLTSKRPKWTLGLIERVARVGPAVLARKLWRGAAATLPKGFEPIAVDVADFNDKDAVRTEVQRVFHGRGPDGIPLDALGPPAWTAVGPMRYSLNGTLKLGRPWEQDQGLNTLTTAIHPQALGRAHIEISVSNLLLAHPILANGKVHVECLEDRIVAEDDDGLLSTLWLWYSDWQPSHPPEFGQIGLLTSCRSSALRRFKADCGVEMPRLARVHTGRREYSYEGFETNEKTYRL
jgi:hypothetical protein